MNKLIIENRTEKSMIEIHPYINSVIRAGRLSNNKKQYCYATTFKEIVICSYLNKKSDRLVIID